GGQRPVLEPAGGEQPAAPVDLHDERLVAPVALLGLASLVRPVVGPLGLGEVGHVQAGPLAGLLVPPDVALALRPGLAVGVGRGPVVEDPPVGRPGPAPLGRDRPLLAGRLAAGGLVDLAGVAAAVDPAAAGGR